MAGFTKKHWATPLKALLFAIAAFLFTLVAGGSYLNTDSGRTKVLQWLNEKSSHPNNIVFEGLRGSLLTAPELAKISFSDERGVWLEVREIAMDWSATRLLFGNLDIDELSASHATLYRLPASKEHYPGNAQLSLALPTLPLDISIGAFKLETLDFEPAALGLRATFAGTGKLQYAASETLALNMDLIGKGRFKDSLAVTINYSPSTQNLMTDIAVNAPKGGFFGHVIGIEDIYDLEAAFQGNGAIDDWNGSLAATVENETVLQAVVLLQQGALKVNAQLDGGNFIPEESAAILGRKAYLFLNAVPTDDPTIREISVDLSADTLKLNASGKISIANVSAPEAINYSLEVLDTETLNQSLKSFSVRPFGMNGQIKRPAGNLVATGSTQKLPVSYADELAAELSGQFTATFAPAGMVFSSNGSLENMEGPLVDQVTTLVKNGLDWTIDARRDGGSNEVAVTRLGVKNDLLSMDAAGTVSLTDQVSTVKIRALLNSLSSIAAPASGQMQADTLLSLQGNEWDMETTIALTNFSTGTDILDELFGAQPSIAVSAGYRIGEVLEVPVFTLSSDHLQATGTGAIVDENFQKTSNLQIKLTDLKQVQSLGSVQLAGNMDIWAELSGPVSSPNATVTSTLNSLDLQSILFQNLSLQIDLDNLLTAPVARASLTGDSNIGPLVASTNIRSRDEGGMNVSALMMTLGPYQSSGQIQVHSDGRPFVGVLSLSTEESANANHRFGSHSGTLRLEDRSGIQFVSADISTTGIQSRVNDVDVLSIASAELSGSLLLEDSAPQIDLDLTINGVSHPQLEADTVEVRLTNTLHDLAYRVRAANARFDPFDVTIEGKVRKQNDELSATAALAGRIRDLTLSSQTPIAARYTLGPKNRLQIDPFELAYGDGLVSGHLRATHNSVDALATFSDANLAAVSQFLPAIPITGTLDGQLQLVATGNDLAGDFQFGLKELTADGGITLLDEDLTLHMQGSLNQESVSIIGAAQLNDQFEASLKAVIPTDFSMSKWTFDLAQERPLQGDVKMAGEIGVIWPLFEQFAHDLDGGANANLRLRGTALNPILEGVIEMKNGRYENTSTGFVAEDIELSAEVQDRTLSISAFRATDGDDGKINLEGIASLSEDLSIDVDANLRLQQARLIRKPKVSLTATSDLIFTRDSMSSSVSGDIMIDRANIGAVSRAQSTIPTLKVREINGNAIGLQAKGAQKTGENPIKIDVNLRSPGKLFIRSYGVESEWTSNLKVTGNSADPRVNGTAELIRGTFDFSGKRFDLTSGSLSFDGQDASDPIINVRAEHSLPGLTAILNITGRASAPVLEITSVPSFPQDEILARVFFGTSAATLSPIEAVQLASTVHALTTGGGQGLVGGVRRTLGIDRLAFDQADNRDVGTTITGGKYLTNNIYVEVTTAPATGETATAIEVGLTKNLSLITRRTLDHDNNLAIRWSWNY